MSIISHCFFASSPHVISVFDSFIPVAAGGGAGEPPGPSLQQGAEANHAAHPAVLVFQHHFPKQLAKARALHSLSQLYSPGRNRALRALSPAAAPAAQGPGPAPSGSQAGARPTGVPGKPGLSQRPRHRLQLPRSGSTGPFGPSTDFSALHFVPSPRAGHSHRKPTSMGPFLSSCCPASAVSAAAEGGSEDTDPG